MPFLLGGIEHRARSRPFLGRSGRRRSLPGLRVVAGHHATALTEVLLLLRERFPLARRGVVPRLEGFALADQGLPFLGELPLVLLDSLLVAQDLRDRLSGAVVDPDHRHAVRAFRLLGDDLHIAVLDPDLAVLARRVHGVLGTGLAGRHVARCRTLRPEGPGCRTADGLALGVLVAFGVSRVLGRVEVQVVGLRATLAVVDGDLHLPGGTGLGDRDLLVALPDRGGVLVVVLLDRLTGFRIDRVRLARTRVVLQRLPGHRVGAVLLPLRASV